MAIGHDIKAALVVLALSPEGKADALSQLLDGYNGQFAVYPRGEGKHSFAFVAFNDDVKFDPTKTDELNYKGVASLLAQRGLDSYNTHLLVRGESSYSGPAYGTIEVG